MTNENLKNVLMNKDRPAHYGTPVTPWCLQQHMVSSGNVFVDSRRTDVMEYVFRMKDGKLLDDLKKARHCLDAAIAVLEKVAFTEKEIYEQKM